MDNPCYQQEAVIAPVDESDFPTKFFQTVLRQHSDAASTALHLLIDQWAEDGLEERRWKYFNSLLSTPNVNINALNRDGITLLESTVNKHLFKLARKLLDIGAVVPNQRVRQVMQEYTLSILKGNNAKIDQITISDPEEELWTTLFENNEEKFQILLESNTCGNQGEGLKLDLNLSVPNRNCTMLQYACQMEMEKVVECLLAAGVEPYQTTQKNSTPPIVSAAIQGNEKILQMLINTQGISLDAIEDVSRQTALHKITIKMIETGVNNRPRYGRCLQVLLTKSTRYLHKHNIQLLSDKEMNISVNVNAKDIHGNSPLHYAAMSGVEDAVIALVNNGAYLGLRNLQGEIPIKWILPSTLKLILDSCIRLNGDKASSRDFSITFDYSLLLKPRRMLPLRVRKSPPVTQLVNKSQDVKITLDNKQSDSATTQREKIYPECEGVLLQLSRSPAHHDLLKHPLITSFLALKWHTVYTIYWLNLFLFIVFLGVITSYTLLLHKRERSEAESNALWHLWNYLVLYLVCDFLKLAFQVGMVPLRMFTSFSFYIQTAMLGFTIAILPHYTTPDSCRHYSAAAVLLAWARLMLSLGHHPRSIPITMFAHVLKTFVWLLLWYSSLLVGFGISLFFIFGGSSNNQGGDDGREMKRDEFHNFPLSMVKLSTMVIGEFDYSNLPFDNNPVFSRIILVAFVFLVVIVMINLLNGMAVSDTHKLRCKAETIGNVRKVHLISYLETLNMMSIFNSHSNWSPFTFILKKCPNSLVFRMLRTSSLAMKRHKIQAIWHQRLSDNGNNQGVFLGKIYRYLTGLFFNSSSMVMCLSDKTYTVQPHHKLGDPKRQKKCACHADFEMDSKILRAAVERVQKFTSKIPREADWNVSPLALLMD